MHKAISFIKIISLLTVLLISDDHCASYPCEHGGTCKNTGKEDYKCICVDGYDGKNCELRFCTLQQIKNCGTAKCVYKYWTDTEGSVECICENGKLFDEDTKTCIGRI